jgi:hypothetical protein
MTQSQFTRSEIRRWARSGQLTPERIAAIEAAHQVGNVSRDSVPTVEQQPPTLPAIGGTEIRARAFEARREAKTWWRPR